MKIFAGEWLEILAKFTIILGIIWLISTFFKVCSPETKVKRVSIGETLELGDSEWPHN